MRIKNPRLPTEIGAALLVLLGSSLAGNAADASVITVTLTGTVVTDLGSGGFAESGGANYVFSYDSASGVADGGGGADYSIISFAMDGSKLTGSGTVDIQSCATSCSTVQPGFDLKVTFNQTSGFPFMQFGTVTGATYIPILTQEALPGLSLDPTASQLTSALTQQIASPNGLFGENVFQSTAGSSAAETQVTAATATSPAPVPLPGSFWLLLSVLGVMVIACGNSREIGGIALPALLADSGR